MRPQQIQKALDKRPQAWPSWYTLRREGGAGSQGSVGAELCVRVNPYFSGLALGLRATQHGRITLNAQWQMGTQDAE